MKKIYLIIVAVLLALIAINHYYLKKFNRDQIVYQKNLVLEQSRLVGSHMEQIISNYENDLTKILFKYNYSLPEIFNSDKVLNNITSDLRSFYSKYRDLVSNVSVFDNKNRYLGIYVKDNDEFVLDTFPRQRLNKLYEKEIIIRRIGYYQSYFPFFKNNELYGNVEVEINIYKFLAKNLSNYRINELQWQWLADNKNQVLFTNRSDSLTINEIKDISSAINEEREIALEHSYSTAKHQVKKLISAVYPLNVLNNDLGLVFSLETSEIINVFNRKNQTLLIFSFFMLLAVIVWLIYFIYKVQGKVVKKGAELFSLKMIVEQFPVGIIIQDALGRIKYINRKGQKMLFINNDEEIIGKTLSNQFMISNKYLLKDEYNASFDSNQFIHYEKDGSEVVIYRRDVDTYIAGEELMISALIDVSSLEKSRKQEAAANMAKSDFLAKMSHEIRNPMNAIIVLSDNLLRGKLSGSQKEELQIIKHSSELLLNILNDILDFSKIEAGKMMLEQIPFRLSEELKLSLELYKHLADEKDLEIVTRINPGIPDNLIGDPFRLRQVISNLVSNAIKFTQKGKIIVEVSLIERLNLTLTLLFNVVDTGIGISKENLSKIFASFEQGQNSVSRKYGGSGLGTTIAKQLVEMMNGEIWVESPSGISGDPDFPGSKFSFSIEVHSNEKLKKNFDFSGITQFQKISILILNKVKDEYDTVHQFLDQLGISFNYRVYNDSAIDDTLFYIEQKKDTYQMLVIMDKPGQNGYLIARALKEAKLTDIYPIVMVSSNDQHGNYLKCKRLGIDYYLIQPYESSELYEIIKTTFPGVKVSGGFENAVIKIKPDLKILYAEDNIINQRVIQSIFKHLGFEIDIAKNGLEAVEMISHKKYDIVFMDILMSDMDGLTATREIRKKIKDQFPIIGISALDNLQKKEDAFSSGMSDYIIKPIKVETIKQVLIKWFSESI
jgi:signal transduction histidine kinase/DNA-binding response OmpR family regulator